MDEVRGFLWAILKRHVHARRACCQSVLILQNRNFNNLTDICKSTITIVTTIFEDPNKPKYLQWLKKVFVHLTL